MKLYYLISALFFITSAKANSYFFSTSSGDDTRSELQAQSASTPWKTMNKLAAFNRFKSGDTILFKRGETFYGSLVSNVAGIPGKFIFYGTYGTGSNPIISGFTQLNKWKVHSGDIYYADLDVTALNAVTVNGIIKGMGRYPNTGYLNYESHTTNTSITDNQLTGYPNWKGAEVVIRKFRWVVDRHIITSHSENTLRYNATSPYGNNNAYSPVNGNGYFIQGHLATLNREGEWYYDNNAKRLYIHFGSKTPSGRKVKAGTVDRLCVPQSYNTFNNIDFEGGNYGAVIQGLSNVIFNDCNFRLQGATSVYGISCKYIRINGGSISHALNNGIWIETDGSYITVNGVSLSNIGLIAGAGASGDGAQQGISVRGNNTTIINNRVVNTGYNGINFYGNNVLVEHNFVDSFCVVKDDGGGNYTNMEKITAFNRIIKNNIVLHAIGAYTGSEGFSYEPFGKSCAIYLDGATNQTIISGNTLAHGEWGGIFVNGNKENTITNNTIYDFAYQIHLGIYKVGSIRGLTIIGNKLIARTASQKTLYVDMRANDNPELYGTIINNIYARPVDDNKTITIDRQYSGGAGKTNYTLPQWQKIYSKDKNSKKSPVTVLPGNIIFKYNATRVHKIIPIAGSYIDVNNNTYINKVSLKPYSSVILLKR